MFCCPCSATLRVLRRWARWPLAPSTRAAACPPAWRSPPVRVALGCPQLLRLRRQRRGRVLPRFGVSAAGALSAPHPPPPCSSSTFLAGLAALAVPLQLFFIKRIADLAPAAMLHGRQEPGAGWARLPSWHSFLENARLRWVLGHGGEQVSVWRGAQRLSPVRTRSQPAAALCTSLDDPCTLSACPRPLLCAQQAARGRGGGAAAAAAGARAAAGGGGARQLARVLCAAHPALLPHLCPALLQRGAVARWAACRPPPAACCLPPAACSRLLPAARMTGLGWSGWHGRAAPRPPCGPSSSRAAGAPLPRTPPCLAPHRTPPRPTARLACPHPPAAQAA